MTTDKNGEAFVEGLPLGSYFCEGDHAFHGIYAG